MNPQSVTSRERVRYKNRYRSVNVFQYIQSSL